MVSRPMTGLQLPLSSALGSTKSLANSASNTSLTSVGSTKSCEKFAEVCKVLREELLGCHTAKEVMRLVKISDKVICAASTESFGLSGRLAYRLRESLRSFYGGNMAVLGCHRTPLLKMLRRETDRRKAQFQSSRNELPPIPDSITSDPNEKDNSQMRSSRLTWDPELMVPQSPLPQMLRGTKTLKRGCTQPLPLTKRGSKDVLRRGSGGTVSALRSTRKASLLVPLNSVAELHHDSPASRPLAQHEEAVGAEPKKPMQSLWEKSFAKMKDDGEIHRDDLSHALELAGFPKPLEQCVESAFRDVAGMYSTLSEAQYLEFIEGYTLKQKAFYRDSFESVDADKSGLVDTFELEELLRTCGIEPMKHVLLEVLAEVDQDASGKLDFSEFERLMELIRTREGFTRGEYEEFTLLFFRFDHDNSGEMSVQELQSALIWLGYVFDREQTESIVQAVDGNRSGSISVSEFLVCMRKAREEEIRTIQTIMQASDADGDGTISKEELPAILSALGYFLADMEAVWEAARDGGIAADDQDFDLSELWRLLSVFRSREGLLAAEAEEITESFQRYDKAESGEIPSLEVGKVLRCLGYPTTFEVLQQLVAKVDVDNSGSLSLPELKKMIRIHQGQELQSLREVFAQHDERHRGYLTMEETRFALQSLHCMDADGQFPTVRGKDLHPEYLAQQGAMQDDEETPYMALDGFTRTVIRFQRESRQIFKNNGGFSTAEVAELRERFERYDVDHSGDIGCKELVVLIEQVFPVMAHDPEVRPQLVLMMKEVDTDGNGSLDFKDFIRLMDQLRELQLKDQRDKEVKAVQETEFSSREVEEFRELFLNSTSGNRALMFEILVSMLSSICPLGSKNIGVLREHLHDIIADHRQGGTANSENQEVADDLDFPEFLWLIHRLLAVNFAGIRDLISAPERQPS